MIGRVPCRVIGWTSYNTKTRSDDGVGLSAKVRHATPCGPYLVQSIRFVRHRLKLLHGRGHRHHCTSKRLTDQLPFGALAFLHYLVVSQSYRIQKCDVSANHWYVAVYDVSIRNTPTKVRAVHVVFEALTPLSIQLVLLCNSLLLA